MKTEKFNPDFIRGQIDALEFALSCIERDEDDEDAPINYLANDLTVELSLARERLEATLPASG